MNKTDIMFSNRSVFFSIDFSPPLRKTANISWIAGKPCSSSSDNKQAVVAASGSSRPDSRILAVIRNLQAIIRSLMLRDLLLKACVAASRDALKQSCAETNRLSDEIFNR
jgi:hypothetical protein